MVTTPAVSQGHAPAYVSEAELVEASTAALHLENRLLSARIERLVALLREHGVALPLEDPRLGMSDGEHLAASRTVVMAAYELLEAVSNFEQALGELRRLVGSGMELVQPERWRQ